MSALEEVQAARVAVDEAQGVLKSQAKNAIKEALDVVFAKDGVTEIKWAQKSSEYNDEGMYPGVAGPVINNDDDDGYPEWLYSYGDTTDARAQSLKTVLDAIGEDVLSNIFGDESIVVVTVNDSGYNFRSEYAGY